MTMATPRLRVSPQAVRIHPTARVDPMASLGEGVEIGPYAIVEAGARIGDRTIVLAHAVICGPVDLGPDSEIHMGAVLGHTPQIRGFAGDGGSLRVGARAIVREHATVHRASLAGDATVIGSDAFLLANSHVAHDCRIGDGVTIANGALLAGFVTLGDRAFISGNVVVHQHVRIGELAIVGGNARVAKDVPPFMMAVGDTRVRGLNIVGMRRAGLSPEARQCVRRAYGLLYRSGLNVRDAVARMREMPSSPEIDALIRFVETSARGLCGGPRRRV
jgi:UDP-N-acetylglucosamine acyltransferase